jgi:ligand-binding SRPBCC domain-containing protein
MLNDRMLDRLLTVLEAGERPVRALRALRFETLVGTDLDTTFAFFSNALNLERLTPPWINFRIRTPLPIAMRQGTIIDYRIVLHGLALPWRTRIDVWEPGARFVDRQIAGPYHWWRHEHRFERAGDGTRVIDEVEFLPRAAMLTSRMVSRDVDRIFDFRQRSLAMLLARETPA